MVLFDIIIPSYNNKDELLKCLNGFSKQTLASQNFRVFACIDGSTDGTIEAIKNGYAFQLQVLEHPDKQNHGRNATRNLALPFLESQYVLFFDSDIVPYPSLLENHLKVLKNQECISVGNVDYLNKDENDWAFYISNRGYNKFSHMAIMPTEYLNMGNVAFSTQMLLEIGGMDSQLKSYGGDDTELALRMEEKRPTTVINNAQARGYSVLNKSLDKALGLAEEFGRVNLKYIEKKFTNSRKVFALGRMSGNGVMDIAYRMFLNQPLFALVKSTLALLPRFLRVYAVHYLVACSLYKGYKSS